MIVRTTVSWRKPTVQPGPEPCPVWLRQEEKIMASKLQAPPLADSVIVEARKLEHHSPHALKVNYKGS